MISTRFTKIALTSILAFSSTFSPSPTRSGTAEALLTNPLNTNGVKVNGLNNGVAKPIQVKNGLRKPTKPTNSKNVNGINGSPKRTFITRDIKTPDPIPESGIAEAVQLMSTGRLYRYNTLPGEQSTVSQTEVEIAKYTGHKYCVGLNSCGSAIMLMMKCAGLQQGEEVMSNAFTFGAVPSAIEHAGGKAVYVESNYDHVMDLADLEFKLQTHPNCKMCLISHMRGKVADMDAVKDLCDRYGVTLLEDCAHSLGVHWKGKHTGHVGEACAISSQSYKMINSGEGGFLLTDNPDIAAKAAVYAGAYEGLSSKHTTVPPPEYFHTHNLPNLIPNYSLRMSNLAAAVIRPQIHTLDERREKYNERYRSITHQLQHRMGHLLSIPINTPGMTPVHDSLQFNLSQDISDAQVQLFLDECSSHGLPVELFGHKTNARNFVNWGFAPADEVTNPLPLTAKMLKRACDVRLPLMWEEHDFEDMVNVICESLEAAVKGVKSNVNGANGVDRVNGVNGVNGVKKVNGVNGKH